MADRLGMGGQVRELKIGASFANKGSGQKAGGRQPQHQGPTFQTVRYDFKPASVDTSQMGTLTVGDNKQINVSMPNTDGAGKTNYG